jgi:hypothetical protein
MGKFSDSTALIMSVFGSVAWKAQKIVTHPSNFIGNVPSNEYIRISVMPSKPIAGFNDLNSLSGLVMIEIFTPSGNGPKRSNEIADILDTYLTGKYFNSILGNVQLGFSFISNQGIDKVNPALQRTIYSLSFSYFGK